MDGAILKNHDTLKLPIDEQLTDLLRTLLEQNKEVRKQYKTRINHVFITQYGRAISDNQSNTNAISKQLTKYVCRYGLKNTNAHAIRSAYAKSLLERGVNVALISKALGHKSLETTTMYLELSKDEVAAYCLIIYKKKKPLVRKH